MKYFHQMQNFQCILFLPTLSQLSFSLYTILFISLSSLVYSGVALATIFYKTKAREKKKFCEKSTECSFSHIISTAGNMTKKNTWIETLCARTEQIKYHNGHIILKMQSRCSVLGTYSSAYILQ